MRKFLLLNIVPLIFFSCFRDTGSGDFVSVRDGRFVATDGTPLYYAGVNFWYGAILASQGEGGDRERLARELDELQRAGVGNLRILVGSDGLPGVPTKVEPTLQIEPGVYNDTILDGLDYLMAELGRRRMHAVLYLNNAWEWSGGYSQYLAWADGSRAPVPSIDGWPEYMAYVNGFLKSDRAKELFANYVRDIVSRTNRYTGKPYSSDPAIFSWQVANEPRAFGTENKEALLEWISSVASLIKSIDPNHMVSTGSEGSHGCEDDIELWSRISALPDIDYANIHIWPYNWGWLRDENGDEDPVGQISRACENTSQYIDRHLACAAVSGKPVVLEEFGFPRDGFSVEPGSPTTARDTYYKYVFDIIERHASSGGRLAGCNIWGWGGECVPVNVEWQPGDPYCGDPAQEPQGLNSVFNGDTTVGLIREANKAIKAAI